MNRAAAFVGVALLVTTIALAGLRWFPSGGGSAPSPAEAYRGRVSVGVHPFPAIAEPDQVAADTVWVARALLVAAGTTTEGLGEPDREAAVKEFRDDLVSLWNPTTGLWPESGAPPEYVAALAAAALTASGPWPSDIGPAAVLESAGAALQARLPTLDLAGPFAAADLLPWAQLAHTLSPVAEASAARLLATLSELSVCPEAVGPDTQPGAAVPDERLTAIEYARVIEDEACLGALRADPDLDADALRSGLTGPESLRHLRVLHVLRSAGIVGTGEYTAEEEIALEELAQRSGAAVADAMPEIASLVQVGFPGLRLSSGSLTDVVVPYGRSGPFSFPARDAGSYLLLDGIVGAEDPGTRAELRSWADGDAPDLTPTERLVLAALDRAGPPTSPLSPDDIDATTELAVLLLERRSVEAVCPVLADGWPEAPTGILNVAVRDLAARCVGQPASGPSAASFVSDVIGEEAADAPISVQLARGIAVLCLADAEDEVDASALAHAAGDHERSLASISEPGAHLFTDWSRAVLRSYADERCDGTLQTLLGNDA